MRNLFLITFILTSLCFDRQLVGQNSREIHSLSQVSNFIDTVEVKQNHARILVTWLRDTVELSTLISPVNGEYYVEGMRKILKDSTFNPTPEEEKRSIDFIKTAAQNCFSYALQKYFTYHNINSADLFNVNTALVGGSIGTIIENSFIKTYEFSTKNKRHFKDLLEDGTLIVFRNKHNWIIHAFYYENGVFYSKNGVRAVLEYEKLQNILKRYWDTQLVQFYKMDIDKIYNFIQNDG